MNQPPDDLTQPIPSDPTAEQAPVPAADEAAPAAPAPEWAQATGDGDAPASDRPAPTPAAPPPPVPPIAGYGVPVATAAAPVATKSSWRSRVSGGKGLAVGALVVGLGLGAVGGSVATWAVVHDSHGVGTTADGHRFDRNGDGDFGPPDGGRGGFPPGGGQRPGGDQQGGDQQQGGGTLPGGGGGTGGSSGSGTDANGTSQAT